MKAPRSLAELPFEHEEPLALLGLGPGPDGQWRSEPDHDYGRFGWSEAEAVVLEDDDGSRRTIGPALVLALHSTDEPSPDDGVIELELELHDLDAGPEPDASDGTREEPEPDASDGTREEPEPVASVGTREASEPAAPLVIRAPLDRFLDVWLPRLPASAPHVVLALCNPLHLDPARPSDLGARNLHYAHGDVLSWLDHHGDRPASIRLRAHAWHTR